MKSRFSRSWKSSIQPRKQRKYRLNAPLHARQKMVSAHLSRSLRKQHGRRSLPLRKGDDVKVASGSFRGTVGKITAVDLKKLKVLVDSVKKKKVSGQEVQVPVDPSNIVIMGLGSNDKKRMKFAKRSRKKDAKPAEEKTVSEKESNKPESRIPVKKAEAISGKKGDDNVKG